MTNSRGKSSPESTPGSFQANENGEPEATLGTHGSALKSAIDTVRALGTADAEDMIAVSEGRTDDWKALGSPLNGTWVDSRSILDLAEDSEPALHERLTAAFDAGDNESDEDAATLRVLEANFDEAYFEKLTSAIPLLTNLSADDLDEGRSVCEPWHEVLPESIRCARCNQSA